MTIKQQGGVFGRNPTFNDVTIDGSLTIDGEEFGSDILTDADIGVSVQGYDADTAKYDDTSADFTNTVTAKQLKVELSESSGVIYNDYGLSITNSDRTAGAVSGMRLSQAGGGSNGDAYIYAKYAFNHAADLYIATENNSSNVVRDRVKVGYNGDVSFYLSDGVNVGATWDASAGNLAFASGGGIDFSATSGTGTSELFDDYEEGNWTPIFEPETGSFGSVTYDTIQGAKYTKIGNVVHIQGAVRTDAITVGTASGGVRLGGLPFTVSTYVNGQDAWASLNLGYSATFNTNNPSSGTFKTQTTYAELFYRTSANGGSVALAVGDLGTGANGNLIRFSGTYITD